MFNKDELKKIEEEKRIWEELYKSCKAPNKKFITVSGEEVEPLYTPLDIEKVDFSKDISFPGEYPYTRGIRTNMYRGRLWTMRQ
ncbi:MAG: methylmalonyl-CoA mutase family protein, partial [candidate division Zixibacteria bacterium]|nr:methylmalonyl-CoA mutase family protein [candidate division Zixibacteria bacterium]